MSNQTRLIAAIQMAMGNDESINIEKALSYIQEAATQGAQIIVLPELFSGHYFPKTQDDNFFRHAFPLNNHPWMNRFTTLAKKLNVVLLVSFFEEETPVYYNSVAVIDADGSILGTYHKSHIPDGPGYQEKFYFCPSNSGFTVWQTHFGRLGVGICWDQWFPEAARAFCLQGADMLFYPTAIGSEPSDPTLHTKNMWQRVMIGHAVANMTPIIAANRIGIEDTQSFYGHSFIVNHQGEYLAELDDKTEGIAIASIDLQKVKQDRASFGLFRDRRPDLYQPLLQFTTTP